MAIRIETERFTKFDRTIEELQALVFFSIAVAGKNASIVERSVAKFFQSKLENCLPYDYIEHLIPKGMFVPLMKAVRLGKYTAMEQSSEYILNRQLHERFDTCELQELVNVPYCGMKTARMILLHSRPDQWMLPLDVHILRFAREQLDIKTPKATPGSKKNPKSYLRIEAEILERFAVWERFSLDRFYFKDGTSYPIKYSESGRISIAHLDLTIWKHYRVHTKERG